MLFNSFDFLLFFPAVCLVYFLLRGNRLRVPFLLLASYYFYMNWKPVYALLILVSTLTTYGAALLLERLAAADGAARKPRRRKWLLAASIVFNLAILFVFKYYNFINQSVFALLEGWGLRWSVPNLDLLLPVGISFYTFQAIGYLVDVYRGDIKAERNLCVYALFVSFFPQLVAGPIERARNLLPQFHEHHAFDYDNAVAGLKQMLWGYFMKLCVADVLAEYVDAVFNNLPHHNGTSVLIASVAFAFQIYCDFGGYSNIAIGAARVMGFRLMDNFRQPYFSLNVKEFWKRWHISLSSWFKDYLYIPLGGNRVPYARHLLNLLITFVVSGLWHGANWTFAIWGTLHGLYLVLGNLFRKYVFDIQYKSVLAKVLGTLFCFVLVVFAWIFFRANTVADAFYAVQQIATSPGVPFFSRYVFGVAGLSLFLLLMHDVRERFGVGVKLLESRFVVVRYASVVCLIIFILVFGALDGGQFIYFQF